MATPALKPVYQPQEAQKEFPIFNLLTKVLIESLCPQLKSELHFGNCLTSSVQENFAYWIDAKVSGDWEGTLGIGADEYTLIALATEFGCQKQNGEVDAPKMLITLHEGIAAGFEKQFAEEDFQCELQKGSGLIKDYALNAIEPPFLLCPVETRFGTLHIYFSLIPTSPALVEEFSQKQIFEPRKIRVFASELDNIYNNVKNLEAIERKLLSGAQARNQMRGQIKKLKRMLHQMRTESLETLFLPARRLTVDIAKQRGKQVELVTKGTWLHLDKTLLNFLYEPILHLIRNAVDHGVEEPAERERLGKPACGTVRCIATFNPQGFKILISDDGKGINYERIRECAVAKGLLSAHNAHENHNEELLPLIFHTGFSTKERTDDISGRGLGLDIVKKGIDSIEGTIRVLSTSPRGTSFEIQVPLAEDFVVKIPDAHEGVSLDVAAGEEDRTLLLDEIVGYFDSLHRALLAYEKEGNPSSAYEAFRIVHSIKGVVGFLGWNKVATFCHHFEDLLKLISEKKVVPDQNIKHILLEAATKTQEFCEASRKEGEYPLTDIRRLEAKIFQTIWSATQNEERTHLFIGKYHVNAIEKFLAPLLKNAELKAVPEIEFKKAMAQPFGALVQFSGDRRGFAGVFMSDDAFSTLIYPAITGAKGNAPVKNKIAALTEFANVMGRQVSDLAHKNGLNLQTGAPLTYYGWGEPMKILGNSTYCYVCEVDGCRFYLAGDFRLPQELSEPVEPQELSYHPNLVMEEIKKQCETNFAKLKPQFNQMSTQSDLIGFDNGITALLSCRGKNPETPDTVLFISYDGNLARYLHQQEQGDKPLAEQNLDMYDSLSTIGARIANGFVTELSARDIPLEVGSPSILVGKAYVTHFNRLFITQKIVGNTTKGKFEIQVLVTKLSD
jgi:HPt (histidine-containing phosphotransfer) domain-containing protein